MGKIKIPKKEPRKTGGKAKTKKQPQVEKPQVRESEDSEEEFERLMNDMYDDEVGAVQSAPVVEIDPNTLRPISHPTALTSTDEQPAQEPMDTTDVVYIPVREAATTSTAASTSSSVPNTAQRESVAPSKQLASAIVSAPAKGPETPLPKQQKQKADDRRNLATKQHSNEAHHSRDPRYSRFEAPKQHSSHHSSQSHHSRDQRYSRNESSRSHDTRKESRHYRRRYSRDRSPEHSRRRHHSSERSHQRAHSRERSHHRDFSPQRVQRRENIRSRLGHQISPPRYNLQVSIPSSSQSGNQDRHQRQVALPSHSGANHFAPPQVRFINKPTTYVLQFSDVPITLRLSDFLRSLSVSMRGISGCSRRFDYVNQQPIDVVYVYAVNQTEVDAAIGRGFAFHHGLAQQMILRPTLISATIASLVPTSVRDATIQSVPTMMLKGIIPITGLSAITSAIDAADIIELKQPNATITHIRIPARDSRLKKMSSMAFVGLAKAEHIQQLNKQEFQRTGGTVKIEMSNQVPVLIPTGMSRLPRDNHWANMAAKANFLVHETNQQHH